MLVACRRAGSIGLEKPALRRLARFEQAPSLPRYIAPRGRAPAARRFFTMALRAHGEPVEVVTDRAPALRAAIEELMPAAFHNTEQYANNRAECDHGRLKARLRPMGHLKRDHSARVIVRGHTLMQNIRRGHYELGLETRRIAASRPRSPNSPGRSDGNLAATRSRTARPASTQQSPSTSSSGRLHHGRQMVRSRIPRTPRESAVPSAES